MSFAASLSRKSSDGKHKHEAELDAWVSAHGDKTFKPACDAAASTGATSVRCSSGMFTQAMGMSPAFVNEQVLDAVTECFRAKLAALGFATCGAQPQGVANYVVDGRQQQGCKWNLTASAWCAGAGGSTAATSFRCFSRVPSLLGIHKRRGAIPWWPHHVQGLRWAGHAYGMPIVPPAGHRCNRGDSRRSVVVC
eukprot:CAMPEP_0203897676 /NCGR_PEP_ID=MMETSP0359-20131031/40279_1 /ASSEMBLY_ACC=CAM_ASM_000338 /TAXON_ID=268821 /ORGANISM="Scrippsiella Hangoei, Strain SHTV-5" /LENGTH=193 /DNA_ID=CAMNT_0050820613 /DNA_START=38 /DNA_END=620 /DNA_ORIENTATION=+